MKSFMATRATLSSIFAAHRARQLGHCAAARDCKALSVREKKMTRASMSARLGGPIPAWAISGYGSHQQVTGVRSITMEPKAGYAIPPVTTARLPTAAKWPARCKAHRSGMDASRSCAARARYTTSMDPVPSFQHLGTHHARHGSRGWPGRLHRPSAPLWQNSNRT